MRVNEAEYFHIPGGHVEIGEDTKQAICREIKEEVGCNVTVKNLFCINENFYPQNNKNFHGIEFYYLLQPKEKLIIKNYKREETDKGNIKKLEFKWVDKKQLSEIDLRPNNVKMLILENKIYNFCHLIKKDKLESGL